MEETNFPMNIFHRNCFDNLKLIRKNFEKINPSKSKLLYLNKNPSWVFIKKKLVAISSTEIRYLKSKNQKG